jgi:hypothetical protein
MLIKLTNNFHDTTVTLRVDESTMLLSGRQVRRSRSVLCGASDCYCSGCLGDRGAQDTWYDFEQIGWDRGTPTFKVIEF